MSDRVERHGGRTLLTYVGRTVASFQFAGFFQTPLDESSCGRIDIAYVPLRDETSQDQLDLWSLVGIVSELSMVEQWVEDSEVCMP